MAVVVAMGASAATLMTSTAWAINNGTEDTADVYPYVPRITIPKVGTGIKHCSGILITPRWILTAAHCFFGHTGLTACGDIEDVVIDPVLPTELDLMRLTNGLEEWVTFHPLDGEQDPRSAVDALASNGGTLNACSAISKSQDYALIHLARRIDSNEATPFHPPIILGQPPCTQQGDFDGLILGYGRNKWLNWDSGTRRYNFVGGWSGVSAGSLNEVNYETTWFIFVPGFQEFGSFLLAFFDPQYSGMQRGDSGGPLLEVDGNGNPIALCGVASAPWFGEPIIPVGFEFGNSYAAIDTPQAQQFIESFILGNFPENPLIDGWYEGECKPPDHTVDADSDGDGIPNPCDNCPVDDNPLQENMDWQDEQGPNDTPRGDACDQCFGPNTDGDGDGCFDACEACPFLATEGCGDVDDDQVCDDVDNCRFVENPDQENSNIRSEIAHPVPTPPFFFASLTGPWRPGDACDSVPVPSTHTLPEAAAEEFPCIGSFTEHDKFSISALASHPLFPFPAIDPQPAPQPIATPVRFCHDHGTIKCDSSAGIDDIWLIANGCAPEPGCNVNDDPEDFNDYYHRITFTDPLMGNGLEPNDPAATLTYSQVAVPWPGSESQSPSAIWEWAWQDDFTRWTQTGLFDPLFAPMDHKELHGVLWLHATTFIGGTDNSLGTGLHGAELANQHLVDYAPWRFWCADFDDLFPPLQDEKWLIYRYPEKPEPDPWRRVDSIQEEAELIVSALEDPTRWGMIGGTGEATFLQTIDDSRVGATFAARLADPALEQVNAVEPSWHQGAGKSFPFVVWLNKVGGDEIVDVGTTDGLEVLASADRAVCPAVLASPAPLTPAQQAQEAQAFEQAALASQEIDRLECARVCASGVCLDGAAPVCCVIPCANDFECLTGYCAPEGVCDFPPRTGSPHAVDYVPVLSRTRRGLFVVGGNDVTSGKPTGEIWFTALGAGEWSLLRVSVKPAKVLAATYAWRTRSLYFLDEALIAAESPPAKPGKVVVCHSSLDNPDSGNTIQIPEAALPDHLAHGDTLGACPERLARLVQVEVDNPNATILASWPRHTVWDRHYLTLDRDGALLLASSSTKQGKHAIARIDIAASNEPGVDGVDRGSLALAFPPVVDPRGYTLVRIVDATQSLMERVRKDTLDLEKPGTLAKLGDQL